MGVQTKTSYRFSLTKEDMKLWVKNAAIFLIPVAIIFVGDLLKVVPKDWEFAATATYILSQVLALLKYWAQYRTY